MRPAHTFLLRAALFLAVVVSWLVVTLPQVRRLDAVVLALAGGMLVLEAGVTIGKLHALIRHPTSLPRHEIPAQPLFVFDNSLTTMVTEALLLIYIWSAGFGMIYLARSIVNLLAGLVIAGYESIHHIRIIAWYDSYPSTLRSVHDSDVQTSHR